MPIGNDAEKIMDLPFIQRGWIADGSQGNKAHIVLRHFDRHLRKPGLLGVSEQIVDLETPALRTPVVTEDQLQIEGEIVHERGGCLGCILAGYLKLHRSSPREERMRPQDCQARGESVPAFVKAGHRCAISTTWRSRCVTGSGITNPSSTSAATFNARGNKAGLSDSPCISPGAGDP